MMLFTEKSVIFPDILRQDKCYNACRLVDVVVKSIGVRAIFGGGLDQFCPKNMGQRPKNECLIPKCSDFGHFVLLQPMEYFSYFLFIIFKMLIFHFLAAARKIAQLPEKIFCRTLGAAAPSPPAHTPMVQIFIVGNSRVYQSTGRCE